MLSISSIFDLRFSKKMYITLRQCDAIFHLASKLLVVILWFYLKLENFINQGTKVNLFWLYIEKLYSVLGKIYFQCSF